MSDFNQYHIVDVPVLEVLNTMNQWGLLGWHVINQRRYVDHSGDPKTMVEILFERTYKR